MLKKSNYFRWDIFVILGLLLVITIILCITFLKTEPAVSHGAPHPVIDGMKVGNNGADRIKGIEATFFIFYTSTILIFIALLVLGVSPRYRNKKFWIWVGGITILVLFSWWKLYDTYLQILSSGESALVLGFPAPTAWMIYGLWGSASLFSVMYVIGFRTFIFTKRDEIELNKIVEAYHQEEAHQ